MFSIRKNGILLAAVVSAASFAGIGCNNAHMPSMNLQMPQMPKLPPVHVKVETSLFHVPTVVKTSEPVADQPKADEATEIRGFQKSVAYYHSGATQAWGTRWYYQPDPDYSAPVQYVADPLVFVAEVCSLPETLRIEPPFGVRDLSGRQHPTIYAGDVMPPSYTAMPALPPTPLNSRTMPDPDPMSAPQRAVAPPLPAVSEQRPPLIFPPDEKPAVIKSPAPKAAPTTRPAR